MRLNEEDFALLFLAKRVQLEHLDKTLACLLDNRNFKVV